MHALTHSYAPPWKPAADHIKGVFPLEDLAWGTPTDLLIARDHKEPPASSPLACTRRSSGDTPTPGASLTFTVKTPPTGSGKTQFAVITGSLTGTSPGFVVDGLVVPAAFDAYSMALLNTPLAIFPGGTVVSPLPNGSATFSLDESVLLTPGLAGSEVVHAVVIIELDLVTGIPVVVSVSNPLTLQL